MSETPVLASLLRYEVGGRDLVSEVSVAAAAGEVLGVIGPNGAGKSTLLRMLGGDLSPTSGEVSLQGRPVAGMTAQDLAASRSMLGSGIPTDIPFTVRTVVEAGRYRFRGLPDNTPEEDRRMVAVAMRATDVTDLGGRVHETLSTGEQARVMIARILAQDSPIMLLDEPTASLDLANAEHVLRSLVAATTTDRTVICVLHDLNAAAAHCDRLLLLADGRLVGTGPPEEVLDEKLLTDVYRHRIRVVPHPLRPGPLVLVAP